jgi:hypothetical protein
MTKKKATLFTTAILKGGWLLICTDIALWLHKSDGYKQITIEQTSNYNPFNLFSLLLRIKNLSSYLTLNKFKKLVRYLNFKYKKLESYTNSKYQKNNISELMNFTNEKINETSIVIDDLKIEFVRKKFKKKFFILNYLTLSFRTIVDYISYFRKSALHNKAYLKYKVDSVYAGLHVLSEALRSDYKSCGSIFHCRLGILTALYKLHSNYSQFKEINLKKESTYVIGPAQQYIYGFSSRLISDQGACFIETSSIQQPYIKLELKNKYYSRLSQIPKELNFAKIKKEKVFEYYKNRIEKPWKVFNYKFEKYSANKELTNLNGVTVILYLHIFTDAQYVYGYDGYHDLMDWCLKTISLLNSNEHVSKVIVKPHPECTNAHHPGDVIANKYLKSQISRFDKVEWADFHFDVNHINSKGMVVGITHHGSVAEELAFKKIPVIASTCSNWGEEYKFGYWWKDVKDYENLISSKAISELVVTNTQIDELYRYANDLYFSENSKKIFKYDSTWQDMLRIYDGVEDRNEHGENMEQINYLVSNIDPEDRQFKEYINTRLQRINLLKDLPTRLTI